MTPRIGLLLLLSLSACTVDRAGTRTDGSLDSGALDSGALDSGALDSGALDSGAVDSGAVDSGGRDAGTRDAAGADAGCGSVETCNGLDDDCDGVIDNGAECPCNHRSFRDHSYLVCEEWLEIRSWRSARDTCHSSGYELVSVNDAAEQEWLLATFENSGAYWIGANDRGEEDVFRWDASGTPIGYSHWGTDEPNDFFPGEDCVAIQTDKPTPGGGSGGWNDQVCATWNRYVCEAGP